MIDRPPQASPVTGRHALYDASKMRFAQGRGVLKQARFAADIDHLLDADPPFSPKRTNGKMGNALERMMVPAPAREFLRSSHGVVACGPRHMETG